MVAAQRDFPCILIIRKEGKKEFLVFVTLWNDVSILWDPRMAVFIPPP